MMASPRELKIKRGRKDFLPEKVKTINRTKERDEKTRNRISAAFL